MWKVAASWAGDKAGGNLGCFLTTGAGQGRFSTDITGPVGLAGGLVADQASAADTASAALARAKVLIRMAFSRIVLAILYRIINRQ